MGIKLNAEQKMKISSLCQKVGHTTSQMAVLYQSLKEKALQASDNIKNLQDKSKLLERKSFKTCIADLIKKGLILFCAKKNLRGMAVYHNDTLKFNYENKHLVQKLINFQQINLGVRKTI